MTKNKTLLASGIFIFILIVFPYAFLGTHAYLTIHDNLDCEFAWNHLLKQNHLLFSLNGDLILPNIMNGIPRRFFHSEFSFIRLLFYCFPSFWAYVVNLVIVRLIGFAGMYLFARDYLMKGVNNKLIILFAGLFSLIPLYTLYGISVMGQPLIIWAFLNIGNNRKKIINWVIILCFPFYAHFAMIAPFILSVLVVLGIFNQITQKNQNNSAYTIAVLLLLAGFIIANYISIKAFLFPDKLLSHRSAYVAEAGTIKEMIMSFLYALNGHYHASYFIALPIYLFCFWFLIRINENKKKKFHIILLLLSVTLIALFEATYSSICYLLQDSVRIVLTFQFKRFTFLIPFLLFVILGLTVKYVQHKLSYKIIIGVLMAQLFLIVWSNEEFRNNYFKVITGKNFKENAPDCATYYSTDLFSEMRNYINKPTPSYRVVSLGIPPAVTQYNGFYTLDGYLNNYPLQYKLAFREIIADELEKDINVKKYFDYWGGRCYLYSAELYKGCKFMCSSKCIETVEQLSINTTALKHLGGKYIVSALPIKNTAELNIKFLKLFSNQNAYWNLYLYEVL